MHARLGVRPEVLSGDEEAALAFDGAVRNLAIAPDHPVLVVDIGGGSTELVLGTDQPQAATSMDIGSVRLHERHLHDDPPTAEQVAACVADIDAALDAARRRRLACRRGDGGRRRRHRDHDRGRVRSTCRRTRAKPSTSR